MAFVTINRAAPSRIAAILAAAAEGVALWVKRRAAYKTTLAELNAMGERDLVDLGISRFDIPAIARQAAARV